jgi:deoxyadenosine/deoxycytidine kinase
MNRLIVIVGPSGAGKTTLANVLIKRIPLHLVLEQHTERPFQALFKQDPKYALANQLDYLIVRAEQEHQLRQDNRPALMDGGLDLDFHGFTRLFHKHGWLSDAEFDLCKRFYSLTRSVLPLPDLIIAVSASDQIISQRLATRNRINIASSEDAQLLDQYLQEWLKTVAEKKILRLDLSDEEIDYSKSIQAILERIKDLNITS